MRLALAAEKNGGFDPNTFLATIGEGRKILSVPKKKIIFAQASRHPLRVFACPLDSEHIVSIMLDLQLRVSGL
jgi:hypothetical protein